MFGFLKRLIGRTSDETPAETADPPLPRSYCVSLDATQNDAFCVVVTFPSPICACVSGYPYDYSEARLKCALAGVPEAAFELVGAEMVEFMEYADDVSTYRAQTTRANVLVLLASDLSWSDEARQAAAAFEIPEDEVASIRARRNQWPFGVS